MIIPYNIGDKVFVEVTITNISVNRKNEIEYYVENDVFGARVPAKCIKEIKEVDIKEVQDETN